MKQRVRELLLMQGFCQTDVDGMPQIGLLARWTPFSCAVFGTAGIWLQGILPLGGFLCPCVITGLTGLWLGSGWFFIALGLFTLTGGFTARSIYDRLYNLTLRYIFRTSPVPKHGAPRRFGCAIGGIMYVLSGIGFIINNYWLAFIPAVFMIVFATIAGLTQWCFASAIYVWLFQRKDDSKANNTPDGGSGASLTVSSSRPTAADAASSVVRSPKRPHSQNGFLDIQLPPVVHFSFFPVIIELWLLFCCLAGTYNISMLKV